MEDDDDEDLDDDPTLEFRTVPHNGGINRIRTMPHPESHIVSTWSDVGKVYIWDLTTTVQSLDTPGLIAPKNLKPIFTVDRHGGHEGYSMDWSALNGKYRYDMQNEFSRMLQRTDSPILFSMKMTPDSSLVIPTTKYTLPLSTKPHSKLKRNPSSATKDLSKTFNGPPLRRRCLHRRPWTKRSRSGIHVQRTNSRSALLRMTLM
jgi:hypothetical protein